MGGSVSWGAGLGDPSISSYSALLNAEPQYSVTNLAIRATGSDYPSHCAESMMGDSVRYDVILLEFTLNGTEGLPLLLHRLRKRYPKALILYIDVYSLKHEALNPETRLNPGEEGLNPNVQWNWSWLKVKHDEFSDYLKKQVTVVSGHMLYLPRTYPPNDAIDMFSDEDWHHLSEKGHRVLANLVKTRIENYKGRFPDVPPLGSWEAGDQCETWFASGATSLNYKNALVRDFAPFKYSMEFHSGVGIVVLHNRKRHKLPLFISFMTRYSVYPITEVRINNRLHVLDPHTTLPDHIMKTVEVGYADPGKNIITFTPQPGPTTQPFRLTAIILCGVCHWDPAEEERRKKEGQITKI